MEDSGTEFELIVKLDKTNKTFSVVPQEYVTEKYGNIVEGQKYRNKFRAKYSSKHKQYIYRKRNYRRNIFKRFIC